MADLKVSGKRNMYWGLAVSAALHLVLVGLVITRTPSYETEVQYQTLHIRIQEPQPVEDDPGPMAGEPVPAALEEGLVSDFRPPQVEPPVLQPSAVEPVEVAAQPLELAQPPVAETETVMRQPIIQERPTATEQSQPRELMLRQEYPVLLREPPVHRSEPVMSQFEVPDREQPAGDVQPSRSRMVQQAPAVRPQQLAVEPVRESLTSWSQLQPQSMAAMNEAASEAGERWEAPPDHREPRDAVMTTTPTPALSTASSFAQARPVAATAVHETEAHLAESLSVPSLVRSDQLRDPKLPAGSSAASAASESVPQTPTAQVGSGAAKAPVTASAGTRPRVAGGETAPKEQAVFGLAEGESPRPEKVAGEKVVRPQPMPRPSAVVTAVAEKASSPPESMPTLPLAPTSPGREAAVLPERRQMPMVKGTQAPRTAAGPMPGELPVRGMGREGIPASGAEEAGEQPLRPSGGSGGGGWSVVSQVSPVYPPAARRRGLEGSVVLLVRVDADGSPIEVEVETSERTDFATAAQRAVEQWRFEVEEGFDFAERRLRVTVEFRLTSER